MWTSRSFTASVILILGLLAADHAQAREIAFTFDDAPRSDGQRFNGAERTEALIQSLADGGVEGAIFFSTARGINEAGNARMLRYQEAGHFIANHSYSHPFPHNVGLDAYLEDVRRADEVLRQYDSFVPLYRYPYLNEGRDLALRDGIRAGLADMGYSNGFVTVDNYDYYMEYLYQEALKAGRDVDMQRLGDRYVQLLADAADFYDDIAEQALGRSPRHVLLLHENDLAALFVDELAEELRLRGWTIIPGPSAYEDPIAEIIPDTLFNGQGRVAAIAETQGVPRRELIHEAEDEAWLEAHFEAEGVFGGAAPWSPYEADLLFSSNRGGTSQVYLRPAGSDELIQLTRAAEGANYPVWSPDGSRIAYQASHNGKLDIWLMNADGSDQRQLTRHPEHDYLPSWAPDGEHITFLSWRREAADFDPSSHHYIMATDGSGQRRLIQASPRTSSDLLWLPGGERLIQTRRSAEGVADFWVMEPDSLEPQQISDGGRFNSAPALHPGGKAIVFYSSGRDGARLEVMALDGSARRVVQAEVESWEPDWSPDGCWLVYTVSLTTDNSNLEIWAMPVDRPGETVLIMSGPGRESEASWRPDPQTAIACQAL